MPESTPYTSTISLPESVAGASGEPDRHSSLKTVLKKVFVKWADPNDASTFLPNQLARSPIQPYHADRWSFGDMDRPAPGSGSLCMAMSPTGLGEAEHGPHIRLAQVYVDGLANAVPMNTRFEENSSSSVLVKSDLNVAEVEKHNLPSGVPTNLVIKAAFEIQQPCVTGGSGDNFTVTGYGTMTMTIRSAVLKAHFTVNREASTLKASVSLLSLDITGLDCSDEEYEDSGPQMDVNVCVANMSGDDKKTWHDYIDNLVNTPKVLCFLRHEINEVLARKDTRAFFADIFTNQVEAIIHG